MKKKVHLSTLTLIYSTLCLITLLACAYLFRNTWNILLFSACIIVWSIFALFYMPLSISVNESELNINRSLRIKSIPLSEIKSVKLCPPTMAEHRLLCSGGWFGYWGWFSEASIGRYFAYYGKSSDRFLVELKNGKKYIIGCEEPGDIVSYIDNRLK